MKIKTDFVTNSSSTAYIVSIPKNFHADCEEVRQLHKSFDEMPETELFSKIDKNIKILKDGGYIWFYGDSGVAPTIFYIISQLCKNHKYQLSALDINGEGNNKIQGVLWKTLKEMIKNEN